MEPVYDGLIERLDLGVLVTGGLRINVSDVAVPCVQFHVYVFALIKALPEESRGNQQHQGERGLQNNESALQEGGSLGGRTRIGAQRFDRLCTRGHHRWGKTKKDARDKREAKGKYNYEERRRSCDRHVALIRNGVCKERERTE